MAVFRILGKTHEVGNRIALKVLIELQEYLSSHCFECDKAFEQNEQIVQYGALIPGNQGLLCAECAELLLNLDFEVEELNECVNCDGTEENYESVDSSPEGEQTST